MRYNNTPKIDQSLSIIFFKGRWGIAHTLLQSILKQGEGTRRSWVGCEWKRKGLPSFALAPSPGSPGPEHSPVGQNGPASLPAAFMTILFLMLFEIAKLNWFLALFYGSCETPWAFFLHGADSEHSP